MSQAFYVNVFICHWEKKVKCHLKKVNVVFGLSLKNSWYKNDVEKAIQSIIAFLKTECILQRHPKMLLLLT